jgi:hypothetical protein
MPAGPRRNASVVALSLGLFLTFRGKTILQYYTMYNNYRPFVYIKLAVYCSATKLILTDEANLNFVLTIQYANHSHPYASGKAMVNMQKALQENLQNIFTAILG